MSSGRYHWGGWTVDLSGDGAGRMASIHEAWHDRLQFTTIYGLLVQHLWSVGDAAGDPRWTRRGDDLLHEDRDLGDRLGGTPGRAGETSPDLDRLPVGDRMAGSAFHFCQVIGAVQDHRYERLIVRGHH